MAKSTGTKNKITLVTSDRLNLVLQKVDDYKIMYPRQGAKRQKCEARRRGAKRGRILEVAGRRKKAKQFDTGGSTVVTDQSTNPRHSHLNWENLTSQFHGFGIFSYSLFSDIFGFHGVP